MEFDILTILAILMAVAIGIALYYVYNSYNTKKINNIFSAVKTLFDTYGDRILKDNPELYEEVKMALDVMDKAMADSTITLMEAMDIIKVYVPLTKRLTEFIKKNYA